MERIDAAFKAFEGLLEEIKGYDNTIFSEQDSRVKVIDRILTEVLLYSYDSFFTEPKAGKGFIDYKVHVTGIPRLIIEAKKDGVDFDIDTSYSGRAFNLDGPVFKDRAVQSGLDQAIYYAAYKGVELSCLTNGKTWIIFRANRQADGKDVMSGKGFVFSSLESIKREFKIFYELLSPEGIGNFKYRAYFQEAEGDEIRVKEFSKSLKTENTLLMMDRGPHSHDFDRIMTEFFSRLSGDSDPEMLTECFVETNESRAAEKQLIRISEDLLSRIRSIETKEAELLRDVIERVQTTNRHEFVIMVGGKGAGKTTFIERFFKKILEERLRDSCIVIRINLAESDGDIKNILAWLNHTLLEVCEKEVYKGKPSFEEILGMYYFEYERLSTGPWKTLYTKDKDSFRIDFGKRVEDRREHKPNEYIKRMIGDITKSRGKVPCIIFDNTDHFSIDFQETVFQYARSIYEKEICLVIVPITDKTSWQLSKQGAIQSFENEVLFLPTPLPRKIIEKRIEFLERKIEIEHSVKAQYFLSRGIKLEIKNIEAFVKYLQGVFLRDENVAKWVGSLSNYDIRRCLELIRDIIASPHLSMEEFLKAYTFNKGNREEDASPVKPARIKSAIIKKFYDAYPINHHMYVQNLFYFTSNVNTTPLLSLRILQMLVDRKNDNSGDNFLSIDQILDYFNGMGIDRTTTLKHLDLLLKKALIFSYDPTILSIEDSKRVELSPAGFEHYLWCLNDNDYFFAMLEVTPITNEVFFGELRENFPYWDERNKLMIGFLHYLGNEDKHYCLIPDHAAYKGQNLIFKRFAERRDMMKRWIAGR